MKHDDIKRIGLVGCGGRTRGVVKMLCRVAPWIEVVAIHDPDPSSLDACRQEVAPEAEVCPTLEALVGHKDVDWVFIGSINCAHAGQAVAALKAGKNVFCEKPLALDIEEAEQITEAWKASGCTFALGLVLRYSPLYRAAKEALEKGSIGRLLSFEFNETLSFNHGGYIHGNWRRFKRFAGSHLLEKCCHDLDLALWLTQDLPVRVASFGGCRFFTPQNRHHQDRLGPDSDGKPAFQTWPDPHGVNPFTGDNDIVDHQVAILEFASGIRATFHTNCMAGLPERRFYLVGSEGSMRLDAYSGRLEIRRVGWDEPLDVSHPITGDGHGGADEPMCRALADCMAGRAAPAAGLLEGIRSLVLANAIDQAMEENKIIDVSPLWRRVDDLGTTGAVPNSG